MEIRPRLVLDEDHWVDSEEIGPRLQYTKKWPPEHWKLAFQGNLHRLPDSDLEVIREVLEEG